MSDTPETDACWDDKECNILEHARRLERDRDEQCRLLGMSAERECDLRGELERERSFADRLAQAITDWRIARWGKFEDTEIDDVQLIRDTQEVIHAWREVRDERR